MIPDSQIVIPCCSQCGEELLAVLFQVWPTASSTWICMQGCGGMMMHDEYPNHEQLFVSVWLAERVLDGPSG